MSTTSSNFKRDIESALSSSGLKLSNNLLSKFVTLSNDYRFSAKRIADTWKDFVKTHKVSELNDSNFNLFRDAALHYSSSKGSDAAPAVVGREGLGRRSVSSSQVTPYENTSHTNVSIHNKGLSAIDLVTSKESISSPMRSSNHVAPVKQKSVSTKNSSSNQAPNNSNVSSGKVETDTTAIFANGTMSNSSSNQPPNSSGSSVVVTPGKLETDTTAIFANGTMSNMTSFLKYEDRKNKGQVMASYHPQNLSTLTKSTTTLTNKRRCTIQEFKSPESHHAVQASANFRYMFCPNSRRAEALEKKWQHLRRVILSHLQSQKHQDNITSTQSHEQNDTTDLIDIDEEEIPVGIPQSSPHVTIGRICNEAHSGTLNAASMVLEGSKSRSNGARIYLDVSNLVSPLTDSRTLNSPDGWSFFPGQMVALQGRNVSGRKMIVDQVVAEGAPPPPLCKTLASKLMDYHHGMDYQNGSPLRLVVACGPFTTQDNLSYDPLGDLLNEVLRMHVQEGGVDLVILLGPFVDVRQPLLMDAEKVTLENIENEDGSDGRDTKRQKMHVPYESVFAYKVAVELEALYEKNPDLPTQFVLVPSIDDAVSEPTYPQPPIMDVGDNLAIIPKLPGAEGVALRSLGLNYVENAGREPSTRKMSSSQRRIHCVPNPCTLKVNEITIGLSSVDSLLHLSSEETNGNLEPGTRLTRLASHFIRQRSYYPLFPPPSSAGMELNLDLSRSDLLELPCQPDLLVIPSKLATFCKCILDKTVVINPGHLVKGSIGGSYTDIMIHPMKRETLEAILDTEDVELAHDIQDRVRVDIKKI